MSHTSRHPEEAPSKTVQSSVESDTKNSEKADEKEGPRRSERIRTLTEKGRELQEQKLKGFQRKYKLTYDKWRYHARLSKEVLKYDPSEAELNELKDNVESTCSEVKAIYEELRCVQTPDPDLRRRVDTCITLSDCII